MRRDVDVAIIGGGLVGCSTALALREKGLSVALFERGFCGAQASGVNYGGVRRQGRPMAQMPLALRAHAIWQGLRQRIGIDGEFQATGHLKLARNASEMASLEAYAEMAARAGLSLDLIGEKALAEHYPWISTVVVGGSLSPQDGQANPRLVAAGYAAAARRAGAELFENCAVVGATRVTDGFALEAAGNVQVRARALVNSAGAWAGPFAADFGEEVPLSRTYPSMVVSEPLPPLMSVNIGVEGGGLYARQVERGNCIIGGERGQSLDDADYSRPRADGALAIMARATALFPALRHSQAIRFWSGTEGTMPDRNPVIGLSRTTPGLVHGFGFSGAGFQIAPAVGEVLAELITLGASATPIDAFSIARFASFAEAGTPSPLNPSTTGQRTS